MIGQPTCLARATALRLLSEEDSCFCVGLASCSSSETKYQSVVKCLGWGTGAEPVVAAAPINGRIVIIVGKDRQVIADAGVDAAALSGVLQVLERR